MAWDSAGSGGTLCYITNRGSSAVSVIDTATNTVTVTLDGSPARTASTPQGPLPQIFIPFWPDLIVSELSVVPSFVFEGETITVTGTIINQGGTGASVFRVGVYFSTDATVDNTDTLVGSFEVPGLAVGSSVGYSRKLRIGVDIPVLPGTTLLYVGLFADDKEEVRESNETNNTKSAKLSILLPSPTTTTTIPTTTTSTTTIPPSPTTTTTILPSPTTTTTIPATTTTTTTTSTTPPLPDLVISQVIVFPHSSVEEKREEWLSILSQDSVGLQMEEALAGALPGEELTVSATVLNLGEVDTGPFRVGVYLSDDALISIVDDLIGSCDFAGLAARILESEDNVCTLSLILPQDLTPGTSIFIGAIADDEFAVEEGDEGNNTNFVEVTIEEEGSCEGVFRDTLRACLEAGEITLSECVGQALAALKECQRGL